MIDLLFFLICSSLHALSQDTKLHFTTAGTYKLKYIGQRANGELFAFTYTDSFDVVAGDSFKLALSNFVGTAFGGEVFASNPIVALVDRGNNVIETAYDYIVTAVLSKAPVDSAALLPSSQHTVVMKDGKATFSGLYIKEVGYPYEITFSISLVMHMEHMMVDGNFP